MRFTKNARVGLSGAAALLAMAAGVSAAAADAPAPDVPGSAAKVFAAHSKTAGLSAQLAKAPVEGTMPNSVAVEGAGVHTCATGCPTLEINQPGTPLQDFCYRWGLSLLGTAAWDLVYNRQTGVAGFTNEHWLSRYDQTLQCAGGRSTSAYAGAGIHTCTSNTCSVLTMAPGHQLTVYCRSVGQTLGGTSLWDLVYDVSTGYAGWTNEAWLSTRATEYC